MDCLVAELQSLTHRYTYAEEQAWRSSLPKVSFIFSDLSFKNLDLYFGSNGNLALEYPKSQSKNFAASDGEPDLKR
jgi:hypothetical protein